mmetsp:Transcript_35115/g.40580  ORF Transcript_35115/g.40580 Transcript_35115/m.40580 type:complete len:159 (+) Transcript_35115:978-1454(+)
MPNELDWIDFNYMSSHQLEANRYIESLICVAEKVNKSILLNNLNVCKDEFEELMDAFKHCKEIIHFVSCKIETRSEVSFEDSLKDWQTETLSFNFSGGEKFSNWGENLEHFENIIKALGKSEDVKKNLKGIYLKDFNAPEETIMKIMKECNLEKVKLM